VVRHLLEGEHLERSVGGRRHADGGFDLNGNLIAAGATFARETATGRDYRL